MSRPRKTGSPLVEDAWLTPEAELQLDLQPELAVVRQVMRRLVKLWDSKGDAIESDEARKLAALIFNGARTAAILLYQETRRPKTGDQDWLTAALEALGDEYPFDRGA